MIDDNPSIECIDVVKKESPDDVALLQVFQLKNGPVCDFDGSVCNTITIRQDNTCIKIKEISVSQLPYPVKTGENEKVADVSVPAPVKKESKLELEKTTEKKTAVDKQKPEKLKNEKQKSEKQKAEKLKNEKSKTTVKQKTEKFTTSKPAKVEKKKKPVVVVAAADKIKPKGKTKVALKTKAKGRPPVAKRPRVASLNAIAKVHCLYENESKSALIDAMAA